MSDNSKIELWIDEGSSKSFESWITGGLNSPDVARWTTDAIWINRRFIVSVKVVELGVHPLDKYPKHPCGSCEYRDHENGCKKGHSTENGSKGCKDYLGVR